jgi:tRNA uridine 5-carboxymethylaminomethyl modification enzyme
MAEDLGIVSTERSQRFNQDQQRLDMARTLAVAVSVTPTEAGRHGLEVNRDGVRRAAYDLLTYPGVDVAWLARLDPAFAQIDSKTAERLETEAKYAVYLDRQRAGVEQIRLEEGRLIPLDFDFCSISGLSNELKQKLVERRPRSVADAQRMEGMTPAALALVVAHVANAEALARRGAA